MIEKLEISPYLLASPRSLSQACIDVTGCGGGSCEICRDCALVQLCAPPNGEPRPDASGHLLRRVGKPVIAGGNGRSPQMRDAALARLRRF